MWESDNLTFDFLVSKLDPVRLNLEGTAEVSIMFLQPRTVHIDRLTPVPTTSITQLTSKLARWTLKNLPPRTTKEGALKSENYENDSLIKFQFSSQANRDPDPGINHDPELPHMLLDSSPDKPGYMITSEEKALIDSEGLSRHADSRPCLYRVFLYRVFLKAKKSSTNKNLFLLKMSSQIIQSANSKYPSYWRKSN